MTLRRTSGGAVIAALLFGVAACAPADPDPSEGPVEVPPKENTPAPDATVGIDEELVDFYTQTLDWERCGGEFDCATLTVPVDYTDPGGDTIELAVLRSPATGDDDPIGSVVVNPGGPGASGVEYARAARAVVTPGVLERYDVVGFDPRGVGQSTPITCVDDATLDEFTAGDGSPDDAAEAQVLQDAVAELGAACQEQSGDLLPHIGTPDVARDLDVLRAVLGDSELTYLGKSYGTLIGAWYAELFGDRVGRMVLDGAMDPAASVSEIALGQAGGFEAAFSAFAQWCVEQDSCALGSTTDEVRQSMTELLDTADADPLPTGDDARPLTESLVFDGVALPLYYPPEQGYPMLAEALAAAVEDSDGAALLELADLYLDRTSVGEYRSNLNESALAVNCFDRGSADVTVAGTEAALPAFQQAAPTFGDSLAWAGLACASWPVHADEPPAPLTGAGAAPIVVIGTTGDPATPYPWAEALAGQLESAVLVTYEGFGHTAYVRAGHACVDEAVDGYLLEGVVPPDRTTCS